MVIEQLSQQSQEMMHLLRNHSCQLHSKVLPQQIRHIQQQSNKDQNLLYNGCEMMQQQQQVHMKMEPDNDQRLPSDMDSIFKEDQLGSDRASPINDPYPITTCSMITNNDPGLSELHVHRGNYKFFSDLACHFPAVFHQAFQTQRKSADFRFK